MAAYLAKLESLPINSQVCALGVASSNRKYTFSRHAKYTGTLKSALALAALGTAKFMTRDSILAVGVKI